MFCLLLNILVPVNEKVAQYHDVLDNLPYSIRILLESAIRNCDGFHIHQKDVENILDWSRTRNLSVEVPFKPGRVLLQDYTCVTSLSLKSTLCLKKVPTFKLSVTLSNLN